MSFSYGFGNNPIIDYPRMLVPDTLATHHIFEDSEILSGYAIVNNTFQSSQFYSPPSGQYIPTSPVNYLRVTALLVTAIAGSKARLASISQILDVKLDPSKAAKALQDQAKMWLEMDENSGAIFIIEQVKDQFSYAQRFWNQVQRQSAGSLG